MLDGELTRILTSTGELTQFDQGIKVLHSLAKEAGLGIESRHFGQNDESEPEPEYAGVGFTITCLDSGYFRISADGNPSGPFADGSEIDETGNFDGALALIRQIMTRPTSAKG